MGKLKLKWKKLSAAIDRLQEISLDFDKVEILDQDELKELSKRHTYLKEDRLYYYLRESLIQRFEICVDLFWKYLALYTKEKTQKTSELNGPAPSVRAAHKAKIVTEKDAEIFLKMIKDRNMTSHIYKDEVAEEISKKTPLYYELMKKYIDKLRPLD